MEIDDKIAKAEAVIRDALAALKRRDDYLSFIAELSNYEALLYGYPDKLEAAQKDFDRAMSILPLVMADVMLESLRLRHAHQQP